MWAPGLLAGEGDLYFAMMTSPSQAVSVCALLLLVGGAGGALVAPGGNAPLRPAWNRARAPAAAAAAGGDVLRFGVIGTGCIGIEHINNLHLCDNVKITAVCDDFAPSREAAVSCLTSLGVADGVAVLDDYHALLASPDVDAVVVCTPNDHHLEVLRAAFKTGKHLLIEKPLCTEIAACAEAEVLAEAAQGEAVAAGRPPPLYWSGMEYRYIPTISRMLRESAAGEIGELRMLTIREHRFPFLRKVGDWNRFTERTGGTLVEKCCHHFDLMRLLLRSEPVRFLASGGQDVNHLDETYDGRASDILDNAYVLVDFECGARALLELCMFAEASKHQEELSLVGTHGKLEAFAPSHGVKADDADEPNYRKGLRNPAFASSWDKVDPPPPEECGSLVEEHESVEQRLLDAETTAARPTSRCRPLRTRRSRAARRR